MDIIYLYTMYMCKFYTVKGEEKNELHKTNKRMEYHFDFVCLNDQWFYHKSNFGNTLRSEEKILDRNLQGLSH